MEKEKYRNELKYLINKEMQTILMHNICSIAKLDSHINRNGMYKIRSLYFDNYCNSCFYDNENGVDDREKMRIRYYNNDTSKMFFEIKRKIRGKTQKLQCLITAEQVNDLINGRGLKYDDSLNPLLKKLFVEQNTRIMKPKVIVEYDRIPYVYSIGNVRITFDLNLRASISTKDFLKKDLFFRPIMPTGINLLEVKYDELIPKYIYNSLNLNTLKQTSFSKYYLCRKMGGLNI